MIQTFLNIYRFVILIRFIDFFYLSLLIAPLTWCPLVQGHVAVPQPAGDANGILAQSSSECVIGEQGIKGKISPSGRSDLLQRSVLVPNVFPSFLLAVPPFALFTLGCNKLLYLRKVPTYKPFPYGNFLLACICQSPIYPFTVREG